MKRLSLQFAALFACCLFAGCPSTELPEDEPRDAGGSAPDAASCASLCGAECCGPGQGCDTVAMRCEGLCEPTCVGKQCGSDGCGGDCGPCVSGLACLRNACVPCQRDCTGKPCGDDGCGGSCGSCLAGYQCSGSACVVSSAPDAGTPDAGGGSLAMAEFCSQFVDLQVARYVTCRGGTSAAWAATLSKQKQCAPMLSAVSSNRASYDPAKATACLAWYAEAACEQILSYPAGNPCFEVTVGRVPAEGGCYSSVECASGWCTAAPASCPGLCKTRIAVGSACTPYDLCVQGASCAAGICKPMGTLGVQCGGPTGVVCSWPGFYCLGATATEPGACQAKASSGACTAIDACAVTHYCQGFSFYPATPGTCAPLKAANEPCVSGKSECQILSYCGSAGICAQWGATGTACGLTGGDFANCLGSWCQADATNQGTCQPYKAPRASCTAAEWGPCGDGLCDTATLQCLPACQAP